MKNLAFVTAARLLPAAAACSSYPATAGTRLDDCQTCHKGGKFSVTTVTA